MKLQEMIATRERLVDALSWEKRVALCGDSTAKDKAAEEASNLESTLEWLAPRIERAEGQKLAREQKIAMIALWVCMTLETAFAGWAILRYWHVFF